MSPQDPTPTDPRWYRDGLSFKCTACGKCCRDHGEYAFVYVSEKDLLGMTATLGMDEDDFLDKYCKDMDGWTVLKRSGEACIFLETTGICSVYEARPKQCATWPYWVDNLESRRKWEIDVEAFCPGIGRGDLDSPDEIDRIAAETESWYEE
jgi:Fe-S-cluster containining protein